MVGEATTEAEAVSTATSDCGHDMIELGGRDVAFDGVFAIWGRTPFEVIVIIDIGTVQ